MEQVTRRDVLLRSGSALFATTLGGGFLAACGSSGGGAGGGGGSGPYKVGMPLPLSGVLADFGTQMRQAAMVGASRVNSTGGIDGRKVELVIEDAKSDPGAGSERTRRLLSQGVDIVIGTMSSAVTLAILPLLDRSDVTFIYPGDGDDRACTSSGGTDERVFGLGDTPFQRQGKFVPYIVQRFGKKWALLGNDYVFSHSELDLTKKLLTGLGASTVNEQYAPLGTDDYSPIAQKIRSSGADGVFAVLAGSDAIAFIKEARESGLFNQLKITGVATYAAENYSGLAPYAEGIITCDRYTQELDNKTNKEFVKLYTSRFHPKYPLGGAAASTYGSFLVLQQAAKKAGSTDKQALRKALAGLSLELPMGKVTIDPKTHIMTQTEYVLEIQNHKYQVVKSLGMVAQQDHQGCSVT